MAAETTGAPRARVLLVEDNRGDAGLIRRYLDDHDLLDVELIWCRRLADAVERLDTAPRPDVALLDLSLPDARELEALRTLLARDEELPIVVLSGRDDQQLALTAVREGAQDYLVKGTPFVADLLPRSLRYAIERHRLTRALRRMSTTDALTGLDNRHGLLRKLEHHAALARRQRRRLLVLCLDLDGLKAINDSRGHDAGDTAIVALADALRETFRGSDLLARMGGDEFAVVPVTAEVDDAGALVERLAAALAARPLTLAGPLSASTGWTIWDPGAGQTFGEALRRADAAMYADKRRRPRGATGREHS